VSRLFHRNRIGRQTTIFGLRSRSYSAGLDQAVRRAAFAAAEGQGRDLPGRVDELDDVAGHERAEMAALPADDRP